ncbi:siphovirus Gp157 family protein [Streptobacillus moniliformis]|uniref:siphovirus Gp157 family protein n=1 Tax=Streptobacillus moniliformis TaxID=34105 RepID=UPI0007E4892C|nr:siphovirus Gp157 family protein [Streptobacillus moniliformis]
MNLIELTQAENEILDLALNDEITEEQFNIAVNNLNIAIQEKGASYIKVLDRVKNNMEQGKLYKKELETRLKKIENTEKKIKNYIILAMENSGLKKIETGIGTITYSAGKDSIIVENEDDIPAEFKIVEYVTKVDKKKILEHSKVTGEIVEGTDIIQKPYITIK